MVFTAAQTERALLEVFDLNGSLVSHVFEGNVSQGERYQLDIDTPALTEGIYFLRLTVGEEIRNGKLIIIRR